MPTYGDGTLYGSGAVYGSTTSLPDADAPAAPPAWLSDRLEYIAPDGRTVTWWLHRDRPASRWRGMAIRDVSGLHELPRDLSATAAPRQWGVSHRHRTIQPRRITVDLYVHGDSLEDLRGRVSELATILASEPVAPGARFSAGRLRVHRSGRPALEIAAEPVGETPREVALHAESSFGIYAVELECPDPRFREVDAQAPILLGAKTAGFRFPLVFPAVFPSRNDIQTVTNPGVAAPLYLEINGEVSGATVALVDQDGVTVEQVTVDGTINSGDRLVITSGSQQSVVLHHPDGTTEDGWDLLDAVDSDPFDLPHGTFDVVLTADTINTPETVSAVRGVWHRHHPSA